MFIFYIYIYIYTHIYFYTFLSIDKIILPLKLFIDVLLMILFNILCSYNFSTKIGIAVESVLVISLK